MAAVTRATGTTSPTSARTSAVVAGGSQSRTASSTSMLKRSSCSKARATDIRECTRLASTDRSGGSGVARSGRARSNSTSALSSSARRWSASPRCRLGCWLSSPIGSTLACW
ncbi:hypothetical protein [Fodinicola feengrottensis]|uniref:hypothetical protein n=1 Tax=Fodinicola feengrottensis TaxID=435914 RepID=UPI00244317D2|nr:hypothetical protein [Fodinicola feengrottensis]